MVFPQLQQHYLPTHPLGPVPGKSPGDAAKEALHAVPAGKIPVGPLRTGCQSQGRGAHGGDRVPMVGTGCSWCRQDAHEKDREPMVGSGCSWQGLGIHGGDRLSMVEMGHPW